jgi:hypothetical protein
MSNFKTIGNTTINVSSILTVTYIPEEKDSPTKQRLQDMGVPYSNRVLITYTNGYQHSVICSPEQYNTLRVMVLRSNNI